MTPAGEVNATRPTNGPRTELLEARRNGPSLSAYVIANADGRELQRYVRWIGTRLNGPVDTVRLPLSRSALEQGLTVHKTRAADLRLLALPERWPWRWQLMGLTPWNIVHKLARPCLIVRQPRYPIQQVLFIIRAEAEAQHQHAATWLPRLTRHPTTVTLLPLPSRAYSLATTPGWAHLDVLDFLVEGNPAAQEIVSLAGLLSASLVGSTVRLHFGARKKALWQALTEEAYDLVVMVGGADYPPSWRLKHPLAALLGHAAPPLLIV